MSGDQSGGAVGIGCGELTCGVGVGEDEQRPLRRVTERADD
jgi:hypothetical protein